MKSEEELMRLTLGRGLRPVPRLSVSAWADKYRQISAGNAEPGRWRTSRTPYLKAVMDAVTEPGIERIVLKSGSQLGKTECLLNIMGRFAHVDPCNILFVLPTLEIAQDVSKSRIMPMINDSKALKPLFYGEKDASSTRSSDQTILSKFFLGGRLVLAGANSPAGLASRPIRILLMDEVDRFPPSAGAEGDVIEIASKRTSSFWNRKIIVCSTPTIEGVSRIDAEYEGGSKEQWSHECPCCGEWHVLDYRAIDEELKWRCPSCGHGFDELAIKGARQKYIAENPKAVGCRSFFISGLYSPWVKWAEIFREWTEARGKPLLEQVFYNTRLGLSYESPGDMGDSDQLTLRLEKYDDEVPRGVLLLTAGVDVQKDRIEYEIVGWGDGEECWGIRRGAVFGSPNTLTPWNALDEILDRQYRSADGNLSVLRTFVDSGFMTSEVYAYCRRRLTHGRLPIKGVGNAGVKLIYRTSMQNGLPLTLLGVNEGKDEVYGRLRVKTPGAQYCHFGADDQYLKVRGYDEQYFRGLNAERKVRHIRGGMLYEQWEPISKRVRNEPLDLRVYALAAMKSFGAIDWKRLKNNDELYAAPRKARKPQTKETDIW